MTPRKNPHAVALGRKGGLAGRGAYLRSLTPEQLRAHQQKAAKASWAARKLKPENQYPK
jgi:hypothetical protein